MTDAPQRVLVTGCGGYLANALLPHLRANWPKVHLAGVGHNAAGSQDWDALHEAETYRHTFEAQERMATIVVRRPDEARSWGRRMAALATARCACSRCLQPE